MTTALAGLALLVALAALVLAARAHHLAHYAASKLVDPANLVNLGPRRRVIDPDPDLMSNPEGDQRILREARAGGLPRPGGRW